MRSRAIAILGLAILAGCALPSRVTPPAIPGPDQIDRLRVTTRSIGEAEQYEIADPVQIDLVRRFLEERNDGWRTTPFTYPSHEVSIAFVSASGTVEAVFWLGPNWIGGTDLDRAPKDLGLRRIESDEHQQLRELLRVPEQ